MLLPDRVEIGFDTRTAELLDRLLNILEYDVKATQLKINALTNRLATSTTKINAVMAANPDPNPFN